MFFFNQVVYFLIVEFCCVVLSRRPTCLKISFKSSSLTHIIYKSLYMSHDGDFFQFQLQVGSIVT